jgi:hypothetical protein
MITVVTVFIIIHFLLLVYYYIVKNSILFQQQSSTDFQFTVIGELASSISIVNMLSLSPYSQQPTTSDIAVHYSFYQKYYYSIQEKFPNLAHLNLLSKSNHVNCGYDSCPLFYEIKREARLFIVHMFTIF